MITVEFPIGVFRVASKNDGVKEHVDPCTKCHLTNKMPKLSIEGPSALPSDYLVFRRPMGSLDERQPMHNIIAKLTNIAPKAQMTPVTLTISELTSCAGLRVGDIITLTLPTFIGCPNKGPPPRVPV